MKKVIKRNKVFMDMIADKIWLEINKIGIVVVNVNQEKAGSVIENIVGYTMKILEDDLFLRNFYFIGIVIRVEKKLNLVI